MTDGVASVQTKVCSHCGREKPRTLEWWYRDSKRRDGLASYCIACDRSRHGTSLAHDRRVHPLDPAIDVVVPVPESAAGWSGRPQRPDQWERCANGHVHTDQTRIVRDNGLVECRQCLYEANRRSRARRRPARPLGWLTLAQAERACGVARATLYERIMRGALPACRQGGLWLVRAEDVQATTPPTPQPEELTPPAAADLLGVTRQRVYQLINKGLLPAEQRGGRFVLPRAAVEARARAQEAGVEGRAPGPLANWEGTDDE